MKLKINFGKRLKELRKAKHLNQEAFAELINISPRNLSKIETGQTFPSSENLEKIITVLDCNAYELFQFEHFGNSEQIKEKFINKISKLTNTELQCLYRLIKTL